MEKDINEPLIEVQNVDEVSQGEQRDELAFEDREV